MPVHRAFCCIRFNTAGQAFIQNDTDHAPHGIHALGVIQTPTSLKVYFDPPFAKVGDVQITTDDGFKGSITGHASFGKEVAEIHLNAAPRTLGHHPPINPADIWKHLDNQRERDGVVEPAPRDNGNLWCSFEGFIA